MPTPRDILELLSRSELLWLADLFRVQLPERLRKEPIVNALASTPGVKLDEMLLRLSRDRLKELCVQSGLDSGGREKASLVERLVASVTPPRPGAETRHGELQVALKRTPLPGQMWRRVSLQNYRSIAEASIELAPFTVVVGPNGSGKSNFADALVFARDIATDAATAVARRGGISGLRRWQPGRPADLMVDIRAATSRERLETDYFRHRFTIRSDDSGTWAFSQELIEIFSGEKPILRIERTPEGMRIQPDMLTSALGQGPTLSETASAMVFARQLAVFAHHVELRHVTRIRLNPDIMRQPQLASEHTRLEESGSNIAVAFRSLDSMAQARVLAAMQRIIPGLKRISVEPFERYLLLRFEQHQAAGQLARFLASEMSEGALRALGILVAAQQSEREDLLIVEEPEVAIHIGAAQLLFDVLKEASTRGAVLVITHSADLLDAARDEEILVCSYREGRTYMGPLSSAQRDIVKQGLFSIAELMRSDPLRIEGEEPPVVEL